MLCGVALYQVGIKVFAGTSPVVYATGSVAYYYDTGYDVLVSLDTGAISTGDVINVGLAKTNNFGDIEFLLTGELTTGNFLGSPWTGRILMDFSSYTGSELYLHARVIDSGGNASADEIQQITFIKDVYKEIYGGIHDILIASGIDNNFDTVDDSNVTAFTDLYFAKLSGAVDELGRITFPIALDLTDTGVQTLLQSLGSGDVMEMGIGYVKFSPGLIDAMNTGATITMNFGTGFDYISGVNDPNYFVIFSSTGASLNASDVITDVTATYADNSGYITFSASHFTEFFFPTNPILLSITSDNAIDSGYATIGDTITVNVVFDDLASGPTLYISGDTTPIQLTGADTIWSGSYTITTLTQGEIAFSLAVGFPNKGDFTPTYGNYDITDGSSVIFDSVANATITYSPTAGNRTTGSVVATITGDNDILTGLNATGHTFTGNGTFEFTFQDALGNTGSKTATVTWINYSSPGGNGGGGSVAKDNCPNGDTSASFYDGKCTATDTTSGTPVKTGSLAGSPFTTEINNAYLYAYNLGITSSPTILGADIEGKLIRSHMAKMMVNYAVKVMGLKPDTTKTCSFGDIENQNTELKEYIKLSCQLGLMGIGMTDFDPDVIVTRAQFGTILSRTLYGTQYEGGALYYTNHLAALKALGIMTKIDNAELINEIRGYVMLMLMRADK